MPRKPTRNAKAKKKQVRKDEYYVVTISSWDWDYSFGLNSTKFESDPYSDYRHLEIVGTLIRPKSVNADSVKLTLIPGYDLDKENRQNHEPRGVGSLYLNQGKLNGLLSIPTDALNPILTMLVADRMKFVVIHGERLRYRSASIRHFRISTHLDEDDLPEGS